VGPRAGVEKRKYLSAAGFEPRTLHPVASQYADPYLIIRAINKTHTAWCHSVGPVYSTPLPEHIGNMLRKYMLCRNNSVDCSELYEI
jgi:hypothetical protein